MVIFLGSGFSSLCQKVQIAQSAAETYTAQARDRILNYYSSLNLITGNKLEIEEKNTIISGINKMFENDQVYVTNDIDPSDTTPIVFKSKEYLENIRLFYSNSEVSFRIDSMQVSDIYAAKDFYFIKIEVFREMAVIFNNQQRRDVKNLDFYVKFVPNLLDCQIYSVKNHEDNLDQFKKVTISTIIQFTKEDTVAEKKPETQMPLVENVPRADSLKVLNSLIKKPETPMAVSGKKGDVNRVINERLNTTEYLKQTRRKNFWLVATLITGGATAYTYIEGNKLYKDYKKATSLGEVDSIKDKIEVYDIICQAAGGATGFTLLEFVIHAGKQSKAKKKLAIHPAPLQNGRGITLAYTF